MKITLDYSSYIRQQNNLTQEDLELETPCSLQTLIRQLADRHGESFRRIVLDSSENLRSMILLSVNGRQIDWTEDVRLNDGDSVTILSPIAGG